MRERFWVCNLGFEKFFGMKVTTFLRVEKTLDSLFLGPRRIYEVALKTFGQSLDLLFSLLELSRGLIIWTHLYLPGAIVPE